MAVEFKEFPKMPRFSREIIITEKIDGTNASIFIQPWELEDKEVQSNPSIDNTIVAINSNFTMRAGSRSRWIRLGDDNFGFAAWVVKNNKELFKLGEGLHFGEWWGSGIQRGYGLPKGEKRFSLFNTHRWADDGVDIRPSCCHVVPLLWKGEFRTSAIDMTLEALKENGSKAAIGYMKPEGIVIFHTAGNFGFKKTIEKDEIPKSLNK